MKTLNIVVRVKGFTWDGDHYEEFTDDIDFPSYEKAVSFYRDFKALPVPDWEMSHFARDIGMKEMEAFQSLYEKHFDGCSYHFFSGAIRNDIQIIRISVIEEILEVL